MIRLHLSIDIKGHIDTDTLFDSFALPLNSAFIVENIVFCRPIEHKIQGNRRFIFQRFRQFKFLHADHCAIFTKGFLAGENVQIVIRPCQIRAVTQIHIIISGGLHTRQLIGHKQTFPIHICLRKPKRLSTCILHVLRFIKHDALFIQRAIQLRIACAGSLLRQLSKHAQSRRNRRTGQRQHQHRHSQNNRNLPHRMLPTRAIIRQSIKRRANSTIKRIVLRRIHRLKRLF